MDIGIQQQHGYPAPSEHAASAICAKDYIYYYYYYFFVQLLLDDIHTYIHTMHASKYVLEPASQAASISLSSSCQDWVAQSDLPNGGRQPEDLFSRNSSQGRKQIPVLLIGLRSQN